MPRLISGKARVVAPEDVSADRYEFLDLSEAEPNLGEATADNYVLYYDSNEPGGRKWDIPVGFTGSQGTQGTVGFTGSQGTVGFTGSQGTVGFTGSQGTQGTVGFTGSQGTVGFTGSQGTVGFTGSQGTLGFTGSQGVIGFSGSQGDTGFVGSQGVVGFSGSQGTTGAGFTGSQGGTGFVGSSGLGFTGSAGAGFTGSQGIAGTGGGAGFTGSQGIAGTGGGAGFTGSQGVQGISGSTFSIGGPTNGTALATTTGSDIVEGDVVSATDFVATSDGRLKNIEGHIVDSLEKVKQLNGIYYYWKDKEKRGDYLEVGVIAQDVMSVLPQAVHEGRDRYLTVSYDRLVALLIEAIKELNEKVDKLGRK